MNRAHPGGVPGSQVIVDRNHMDTLSFQGIQIRRKRGNHGLTFTGFHFSDTSLMQDDTAHQLYAEGFHVQDSSGSLTHRGISLRKQVIQCFPFGETLPEFLRLILQLFIGKLHHRGP